MTTPADTVPKPNFTLTHVIENVSKLSSTRQFSPEEHHFNVPWFLSWIKNEQFFGFHLYCNHPRSAGEWHLDTRFQLKIVSPKNGKSHVQPESNNAFGSRSEFAGWGFREAKAWDTFVNEFVVDDRVVIEAHVWINEMSGIEAPPKLREFDDEKKGDLILVAGDEKFHVSRLYISSVSPYFETLLLGPFAETKKSEIHLKEIDPEAFQLFLELIHMEPTLTDSNVESVMTLVDMYETKNAARVCEEFLMYKSKNSVRNRIRMAQKFKMEKLKKHCIESLKSKADIRSVVGTSSEDLDPEILRELFEKSMAY